VIPAVLASLALLQAPATEARELLDKAEEHARERRYRDARSTYEKLAKLFPASDEGRTASRRVAPSAFLGWDFVVEHGPASNRVDVVLMGDGYELDHLRAFDELAEDVPPLLERKEPFREYWSYFNFVRAVLVSADNGVDGFGREYDTVLGARTAQTFAGHVAIDAARVRAMLGELPEHDGLAICFVKNGVLGTGGGGFATIGGRDASTTIHEWGHAFAGLGDEYETQQAAHTGAVGERPNVSGSGDPRDVPWAHWIAAKHPRIGVYEGAAGRVRGAWKPTSAGCVMAGEEEFCPVCREALVLRIYSLVDPIEACTPPPQPAGVYEMLVVGEEPLEVRLTTMRPASHDLEVRWWVLPTARPARTPAAESSRTTSTPVQPISRERSSRGPLAALAEKPTHVSRHDDDGQHRFSVRATDLEPGVYRLIVRVRDTTELRGEKWPWVLEDRRGLLESERLWWIEVPAR
jgi:hypothetical protein